MYRHLFFDLDNTLWDFTNNSALALRETFLYFSLDLSLIGPFLKAYNHHNDLLWELYRNNGITKQDLLRLRFEKTFSETGITGMDGMTFNNEYLARMPLQTGLCKGVPGILDTLSRYSRMHIITNGFREVQYKKLATSGLAPYFQHVFVSEEIGISKPSPGIYLHALKTCNARKRESLMIGDSWEVDIAGAMKAGIDQVYFQPEADKSDPADMKPPPAARSGITTYRIRNLTELAAIVIKGTFPALRG